MFKEIRKKTLAMLMTLAIVISLLPALTLPAAAYSTTPDVMYGMTILDYSTVTDLSDYDPLEAYYTRPVTSDSTPKYADLYYYSTGTPASYTTADTVGTSDQCIYFKATSAGTYKFNVTFWGYGATTGTKDYIYTNEITVEVTGGNTAPTVTTASIPECTSTTATMGGNVTDSGGETVTERGVVYSSSDATPTIGEAGVTQDTNETGTGIFSESITGLSPNTTYYVRAYATNSVGTSYGSVMYFTTDAITASISATPALTEENLDTGSLSVTLSGTTFADATLEASNFTLNNAPTGVTIESVTYDSATGCTIAFAYTGTDFDANVTTFSLTIAAAELSFGSTLTSGTLTITATVETAPQVTSVSVPSNGTYKIGDALDFTVTFDSVVNVTGTPRIPVTLNIGGTVYASYVSGSNSKNLVFRYTVSSGELDADGISLGSAIDLNSGTIKNTDNDSAELNLYSVAATTNILIDGVAPTISSVSAPGNATYNIGNNLDYTVNFSEAVNVVTTGGTPYLTLTIGSSTVHAAYNSGTGTSALTFRYTVLSGDADANGVALSANATLNGGTIKDAAGNNTSLTFTGGTAAGVLVSTAPTVTGVSSSTPNGFYNAGDVISIQVTFSASVNVDTTGGTPQLTLETGTTDRVIDYVSGSGSATLTFSYTVQTGDNSSDLNYASTGALTLNSGTIKSGGIDATLVLPTPGAAGSLGANKAIVVDTTAPTATISMTDNALKIGETSTTVTITFSEAVTGFTKDDLTFPNGTLTEVSSSDGGITWTATFTPTADITDTTNVITLDNTGVQDFAGNIGTGTTDSINYVVDTVLPIATIIVSDAALKAGETSLVTITFSEAVTGFTNSDLSVQNGSLTAVSSSDGGITWTATLTPAAAITDSSNLITIDLTGVTDAVGNTGSGTTDSNNYAIDTVRPTATIVVSDTELKAGETSLVTITFSEAVTGFTVADFTVQNGSLTTVSSSDGGITWTATFTPTENITDATNMITLNNTGVQDAAENAGTGTTNSNNYSIDTKRPTATITVSDTALKVGETSLVTIAFSEAVIGFTNADLDLTVANGTVTGLDSMNGGITWTATFTPTAGIEDAINVITINMTGVADAAENAGTGTTDSNNYEIDTKRPIVTSVEVPNDGKYKEDSTLSFTVNFSEAVTVTGTPTLTLDIGGAAVSAAYVSGSTSTALVFAYTIVDGNTDTDGIAVGALSLNGGTIKDAAGNDATLTLNSIGSTLGVLVDTTAPTKGDSGTIGVSELTYNSAKLTWTAATDPGTLAENLQYKVVFSTIDITDVDVAKLLYGAWTPNINTLTVTGLTANTDYFFNVLVKDEAGNMALYIAATGKTTAAPVYDSPSTPTPPQSAVVEVNGEKQDAGQTNTQTTDGTTTTTITVDDTKLDKILESKANNATVTLSASGNPDVVVGQLTGQTVKNMETKEAVLEIKTETVTYTLPASQINIDTVSAQLGAQVELKDIKVNVRIAELPADMVKIVEDTANKNSYQLIVKPVEFEITCTSGDKTVAVSRFNGYVERTIAIPDGVDPSKITTGIVLNADGTFSHVPTSIVMINGKYFAKINSLTNSTYSVIYNPITFTDVASHWAKDAINDMGSRMVVTGVGGGIYEPERSITRAEFAAIVVRAMGLKKGTTESAFGDVALTDWFNGYVDTATAYSLITGYNTESFAPNDTITREQAMTILARAMKLTGLSVTLTDSEASTLLASYTDAGLVSDYAKTGVAACIKTGVVSGTTASTLSPKDSVTRAEVAAMVQRLLKNSGLI